MKRASLFLVCVAVGCAAGTSKPGGETGLPQQNPDEGSAGAAGATAGSPSVVGGSPGSPGGGGDAGDEGRAGNADGAADGSSGGDEGRAGAPACDHDACQTGGPLVAVCSPCVDKVCGKQPSCCATTWDTTCTHFARAFTECGCEAAQGGGGGAAGAAGASGASGKGGAGQGGGAGTTSSGGAAGGNDCSALPDADTCDQCCVNEHNAGFNAFADDLTACACGDGACAAACHANFCEGKEVTKTCETCLENGIQSGKCPLTQCDAAPDCDAYSACEGSCPASE